MTDCLFCAVLAGEIAVAEVWSTPDAYAFLDHRPVFKGHVLVLPRSHVSTLSDFAATAIGPFFTAVARLTTAVETGLGAGGSFVAINNRVSQSVPHLHVHVVPRTKGDGLRGFFWPRTRYATPDEAESYAAHIRAALAADGNG